MLKEHQHDYHALTSIQDKLELLKLDLLLFLQGISQAKN
jgi:hypothetical protein